MSSHTGKAIVRSALLEITGYLRGHGSENAFTSGLAGPDGHETVSRLSQDHVQLSQRQTHNDTVSNLTTGKSLAKRTKDSTVSGTREKDRWARPPGGMFRTVPGRKESAGEQEEAEKARELYIIMLAERQIHLVKMLMILYDAQTEITELISEAAARRAKVTDKIADKWASVLGGGSD